jgi:hypothetical protein
MTALWAEWEGKPMAKEVRGTSLESLQERVGTFRLRSARGLTTGDLCTRIDRDNRALKTVRAADKGALLGAMLCDLLTIARKENLDLAFHAQRVFAQMQAEYEREVQGDD